MELFRASAHFDMAAEFSQGSFYDTPESISTNPVLNAEEFQLNYPLANSPGPYLTVNPTAIKVPNHAQPGHEYQQPLECITEPPILHSIEDSQLIHRSLPSHELIGSTTSISSQNEIHFVRQDLRRALDVISLSSVLKTQEEQQFTKPLLAPSESGSCSPGIHTLDDFGSRHPSRQPLELLSRVPTCEAIEHCELDSCLLRFPAGFIHSSLEVVSHEETQLTKDSRQPPELIPSLPDIDTPEENPLSGYVPQSLEKVIPSLPAINFPIRNPFSDDFYHSLEAPPALSNIKVTKSDQIGGHLHQPQAQKLFSHLPSFQHVGGFRNDKFSAHDSVEVVSLSDTEDTNHNYQTESSKIFLQYCPENLAAELNLYTSHQTQLNNVHLNQIEKLLLSPMAPDITGSPTSNDCSLHKHPGGIPASVNPDTRSEYNPEEPEISPLQYARDNGLSINHLDTPCLNTNLKVFEDYQDTLTNDCHLLQFDLSAKVNTDERLIVSKEAGLLIASVSREDSSDLVGDTIFKIATRKYKIPRLELPLLKSDHETDCKMFAKRKDFEIKLQDVLLPLEVMDEENNGGLEFSPSLWNKGPEILKGMETERLKVSREILVYLQTVLRSDWSEEDEKKVRSNTQNYIRRKPLEPVTPPLSPMSSPAQTYEPSISDSTFELPMFSDPESLTKQDLEAIETQIFGEDIPTPIKNARGNYDNSSDTLIGSDTVKLADIYSPAVSLDKPLVSPVIGIRRVKLDDLKVEEPLTPTNPAELPKTVCFSHNSLQWPGSKVSPLADPFESPYFEEAFSEAHEKAVLTAEHEAVVPADTIGRVNIPKLSFSFPDPPWKAMLKRSNGTSLLKMQHTMMKDFIGNSVPHWPRIGKTKVRYNPFSHDAAKVVLDEDFDGDDSTWQAFVKGPGDDKVIDTSALTWKPIGLRALRDDDDDEEIESGQFDEGASQDLTCLAKKRKLELEERDSGQEMEMQDIPAHTIANLASKELPWKKISEPIDFVSAARKTQSGSTGAGGSLLMGAAFSVGNSVENFLEIRGTKKPKLGNSSYFAKISEQAKAALPPANPALQPELPVQLPIRNSPVPKPNSPLPAPPSNIPNTSVNVIVASTLLKHRALIKHIEALFPRIIFVERDFSAHDTTAWMPGLVTRSPITSPLAFEADIIVSPLLGIIITTLQKIKQKPLPGQKAKPAIRERLERVSPRYENLIVLITEKRDDEATRDLDESDCNAFNDFTGFALSLETSISIQFVGGGEVTLAKWLVNAITQHRSGEELLPDETHWELFLRRAGMNAFAAQHIIAVLKARDNIDPSSPSKAANFGLAAFVEMGREQRIARFGQICGNCLMRRVSSVVDARWS